MGFFTDRYNIAFDKLNSRPNPQDEASFCLHAPTRLYDADPNGGDLSNDESRIEAVCFYTPNPNHNIRVFATTGRLR